MPGYNVARTLSKTVRDIPKSSVDEILLIDDGSTDDTAIIGRSLGLTVIQNGTNKGYGFTQRRGQTEALKRHADIVVMLHPDYQYDPLRLPDLIAPIKKGNADLVFGSRMRSRKESLEGGMSFIKYLLNRIYTHMQNALLGATLSEYFSGYRAYSKELLLTLPLKNFSDTFVYDQELMVAAIAGGYRVKEIPVPVRYFHDSSSMQYIKGAQFLTESNMVLIKYILYRLRLYKSSLFHYHVVAK